MKLSSEQIKTYLVNNFGLDSKTLKRVSKKKDSAKNIVRVFSSDLGTHQVVSNPQDETILSVTKLNEPPTTKKPKSKNSASYKIVIRDLKGKEILAVDEIGEDEEEAKYCFECILEQESWIADEVFALLNLEHDDKNYLGHESWESGEDLPREDDTVIEVIVKGKHKYNLTLE